MDFIVQLDLIDQQNRIERTRKRTIDKKEASQLDARLLVNTKVGAVVPFVFFGYLAPRINLGVYIGAAIFTPLTKALGLSLDILLAPYKIARRIDYAPENRVLKKLMSLRHGINKIVKDDTFNNVLHLVTK
jgi:hypothetical protein